MATAADPNISQASQQYALARTALGLFVGLLWGAAMLFVFGFWLRSKYDGRAPIVTGTFMIAGAAAALLAGWQAFTLWFQKSPPAEKSATLQQQRQLISYVFLAGGLGLILLAFALGFDKRGAAGNYAFKPDNFAETFGSLFLGLIALCAGYVLQQPAGADISPIPYLTANINTVKSAMLVVSVAYIIAFGSSFWVTRANFTVWLPELIGLLLLSILSFGCVLWLNTRQFDESATRVFVIVFGGTTGIIVFFMALWRAYLWRQDTFLGGISAWQGENAWHFWVCAYVLFASLVVMLLSFNLGRADIRKDVVLRRVMYGYDTILQGLLLIGILTTLCIQVYYVAPFSFDWTKSRGAYALADSSKALIANLKDEAHVLVLIPKASPAQAHVRNLLDNCLAIAGKDRLKVEYISPDINQLEFQDMVRLFPEIIGDPQAQGAMRGVLIIYGPRPDKVGHNAPHAWVPERKIVEQSRPTRPGEKTKLSFHGEEQILRELKFLAEGRSKRKIYFLQGHDEADINIDDFDFRREFNKGFGKIGIGLLVDRLKADNLDIMGLSFGTEKITDKNIRFIKEDPKDKKKYIPDDCHTLVIAGLSKPLSAEEKSAIENYMDQRNGKMLVFLDVVTDEKYTKMESTGLEAILKNYGVDVTDDYVLKAPLPERSPAEALMLAATTRSGSENPLARSFAERGLLVRWSTRVVKPAESGRSYKGETILHLEPRQGKLMVEKDVGNLDIDKLLTHLTDLQRGKFKQLAPATEPVSIGVAVTDKDNKARMVVFGDTEFITNIDLARASPKAINYSLTLSALEWMAEREDLGGRPYERTRYALDFTVDYWRMTLLPLWIMVLFFISLGIGFWLVRRR